MKIAFLNIYNGVINRGAETFVKELASRLAARHEVVVFQSGDLKENSPYREVKIPVRWDWTRKSGLGTPAAFFFLDYRNRQIAKFTLRLLPQIYKEKFDIVIPVNGGWQPALVRLITWLSVCLRRQAGLRRQGGKMIISGQSGMGWDDRNNLWCLPDTFVALSKTAAVWAKKANPFIRVEYIPNGVDLNKFKNQNQRLKINLPKPVILCVGALTKTKRIDLTIKAVARLKDASLLVVGDGDLRDEIEALGTRLLGTRFKLMKLPYEEMPKVYRVADVFTLVSEPYYAFENVLVEAMAVNLPVVANLDPIREEIVGRAGILVDPTDTEAYAQALRDALNQDWGDIPRKQAGKFSWDEIARKYEKLFQDLLK